MQIENVSQLKVRFQIFRRSRTAGCREQSAHGDAFCISPLTDGIFRAEPRDCAAPCDSHWFSQWFSSFSHRGHGARPGPWRSARRGQGRAPGLARAPWQQQKGGNRINQFILFPPFPAARALFCRVGSLLPQRPVPRQAAAVSLISHWFFHTNLRWCKVCSGGARRCWRGALGQLAAAGVPIDS